MTLSTPNLLLQAEGLEYRLGRHLLVDHVSLEVSRQEIVTVIGPNGAGKTTLLRLLLGLLPATGGRLYRRPRLRLGYLPQKLVVDPVMPLSVFRMMTLTSRHSRPEVRQALEETGIADLLDEPVQTLSGGEFQRMMLSRALLQNPELLVLDEPVQGVDYMGEAELYGLIAELRERRGCGVLMVSHDLHVVMASTDRVVCLNRHVCCEGQPREVTRHPEYLRLFGAESGKALAVYEHHHDHVHDHAGHRAPPEDLSSPEPPAPSREPA
ncbi:MAG: metal ABC transporter ATP-binding protein [bacterium]